MTTSQDYQLVNSLHAHEGPIRCAVVTDSGEIITGCQSDAPNFRRWLLSAESIEEIGQSISHDHWVTAITSLSADSTRSHFPEVDPNLM